jgi:hypothetical protein
MTGLGMEDGKTYYYHLRTITTINGITLPPSPAKIGIIRIDVTKPGKTGEFVNLPRSAPSGIITLQWQPVTDFGPSGLFGYKVRQFTDTSPVPVEILLTSTPSFTFGSNSLAAAVPSAVRPASFGRIAAANTATPLQFMNGETGGARAKGRFYRWQVQTVNGAGTASEWSDMSTTVDTGLPEEVITDVANYPNPVDTRKGGMEGRTVITYLLSGDADVEITIYDLLGYRVMHWNFPSGGLGGRQGTNNVPAGGWDGTNEAGQKVSKGGYLAQIKVSGAKGSTTVIRKIGVIH